MTELGFGAAQIGNLHRAVDDATAFAAVDAAWASGVRYFDTAPHYGLGLSERRLGAALAARPRDDYLLSTKAGRLLVPAGSRGGRDLFFDVPARYERRWDFSRDGIRRSVHESLERLGLDRLDVVYLHDPDDYGDHALAAGLPALAELRDEGVVSAIGAGMNQSAMLTRFVREFDVDVVMVAGRYTLLEQGALGDLIPAAREHGTGVVVAGVYNSGLLAMHEVSGHALYDYTTAPAALVERARRIAAVCAEHGTTLPAAAVAYPLRDPAVVSVVLGARSPGQADENAVRYAQPMPDALWAELIAADLIADNLSTDDSTNGTT